MSPLEENRFFSVWSKLKSKDFSDLRESGKTFKTRNFLFVYQKNNLKQLSLGFTIPKGIGNAPTRNRLKRLLRESFRASLKEVGSLSLNLNVVALKSSKDRIKSMDYDDVNKQVQKFFSKLN